MPGEKLSYRPTTQETNDAFTEIVRENLDANYMPAEAPREEVEVPFGQFVPETRINNTLARLSTSTGYTGNNSEESA